MSNAPASSEKGAPLPALNRPSDAGATALASRAGQAPGPLPIGGALWGRRAEFGGLALILLQVAIIALILRDLSLESSAFRRILYFAAAAFVLNHLLPARLRLGFFAAFSMGAVVVTLGGSLQAPVADFALAVPRGGALLGTGIAIIAVARLPIGLAYRVGLLLAVGAGAALFRSGHAASGNVAIIWPVLASMFMFRVMVYLYDVSTATRLPSWRQSLAYFFLIPNVCTLLFPVIDFRTFAGKYYDEDALVIYQRGVKWMFRGVIHLLLYRLVNRVFGIQIADVANGTDLIRFVVTNSFLYLKISGTFHLVIGMLLLFGFNLPETNHRYFLASSFTDYWRRVNTYWRAFIMKVFYYPAFFKLKKAGQTPALVLATLWSFFITWALHAYQAWWISGTFTLKVPDVLFWTILAVLVLANSLWELRRGRQRKLSSSRYSARETAGLMVRTAATFLVISVLWSLWSAPTVGQWLFVWSLADWHTAAWGALALVCIAGATLLVEVLPTVGWRERGAAAAVPEKPAWRRSQWLGSLVSIVIAGAVGFVLARKAIPVSRFQTIRDALVKADHVTWTNLPARNGGYYEGLTTIDWPNRQFWETIRREQFPFIPLRRVSDLRWNELIPDAVGTYVGVEFRTNRWGMRDRDYDQAPPPGVVRVALLGSSHIEGYGVEADKMFEPILESRLNRVPGFEGRFQVLNFAIGGVSPLGQHVVMTGTVGSFAPQVVVMMTHLSDLKWMDRDIQGWMREHLPEPCAFFDEVLQKAQVTTSVTEKVATDRLHPFLPEILRYAYRQVVKDCRSIGALPVCVFLPVPQDLPLDRPRAAAQVAMAREAGFEVIDLSDIYDGQDPASLKLPDSVGHSNAKANALIAAALFDRLTDDPGIDLLGRARGPESHSDQRTP